MVMQLILVGLRVAVGVDLSFLVYFFFLPFFLASIQPVASCHALRPSQQPNQCVSFSFLSSLSFFFFFAIEFRLRW